MFISADQLLAHAIGDYVLQSDWMASHKTRRWAPCALHVITYGIPFLFLWPSWNAMVLIVGTHYLIDRYRLARFVVFAKNFLAPKSDWSQWEDCAATGYHKDVPHWLSVWLLIVADNLMHVILNALALKYL
jgi:hypothetical protein